MRRVRLVFALLALALLGGGGILVYRALEGVEAERSAQRTTLAARIFDEMERALSEFLEQQESLPFSSWLAPANASDPPFVLARFELGPGGALRLSARAPNSLGPQLGAWAERRAAARDERPLSASGLGQADAQVSRELKRPASQAPAPEQAAAAPEARSARQSLYDALQSLNRGAEARSQRAPKLEAAPAAKDLANAEGEAAPAPAAANAFEEDQPRERPAAPADRMEQDVVRRERVVIDPLLGDRLGAERLLLVRTALTGDRGYRQGLVLDAEALGAWLRQRALGGDALPGASLEFGAGSAAAEEPAGDFQHRFAEPFDALSASLRLPPLPDAGSANTVLRLSLLLALAAGAGLFALYRMVAVALRYAEQRSNFVAAVSHELKTPLTAIRMYGEMLRDGLVPTEDKRAEYYRTITAESERLSRLIDNVLEFARGERGERPLALRAGPLGAEVASLCEALRPHATEAGFELALALPRDLPDVRFDRDAVAQILVNLVDNALKYARNAGQRMVEISCARAGDSVALRVRDHGPGVPPAELGRIFELFHRGEGELARATRGTGLGLALVRSLAGRMGARVSARNAEGGGLEVEVLLPLASAPARAALGDMPAPSGR
jgi:signal transduction histidine kinase